MNLSNAASWVVPSPLGFLKDKAMQSETNADDGRRLKLMEAFLLVHTAPLWGLANIT
ncbi:hypothetical protein ACP4OV_005276 [Aristida adscensionis]